MTHKSVEEFNVTTIEVAGIGPAFKALRLPFGKECRSVVDCNCHFSNEPNEYLDGSSGYEFRVVCSGSIDVKDKALLQTLVKRGDEHAKVLRGVTVWCKIDAPRYWWQECDRYSVGACCLSSNSTMHQQGKGLSDDELIEMKESLKEGTMQTRVWMFSYQTLRRIYFQRKDHRLPQWRMFCQWIESLPFSDELITIK